MKTLLMVLLSTLMMSPAMAFDQADLNNVENFTDLYDYEDINMDGINANAGHIIDGFLGNREFVCVARNGRGARYRGRAPVQRRARRKAMRKCRRDSFRPRSCRIIRCKRKGGFFGDFIDLIDTLD